MTDPSVPTPPNETYRDVVGADGCGCPITAEFTPNGSEVDGSSWTEHRTKCWEIKEPTGYAVTAAELRRIAAALDTLPPTDEPPFVQLSFLTEKTAEAVDVVAMAVLRKSGKTERISGDWYHLARGGSFATNVHVTVQTRVPAPPDERDAEIDRLRAELAEFRAWPKPLLDLSAEDADHGRTTAVAEAKPDTLMVPHGEPHRTVGGE